MLITTIFIIISIKNIFGMTTVKDSDGIIRLTGKQILDSSNNSDSFTATWSLNGASILRISVQEFTYLSCERNVVFSIMDPKSDGTRNFCGSEINADSKVVHNGTVLEVTGPTSSINKAFRLAISYTPWCEPCGFSFTLESDIVKKIESPGYPLSHGASCSCLWQGIVDESNSVIEVTFSKFHLEQKYRYECQDFLKVYDGASARSSKILGSFCGDVVPSPIKTSTNVVTLQFSSDLYDRYSGGVPVNYSFSLRVSRSKKEDELAGLQSVAAILGAISFGIFIGLLLCSVLYKRWSRDRSDTCQLEGGENENDYTDVIQQSAPPSYRKVMAAPEQYPHTPTDSPINARQTNIELVEPPQYPGEPSTSLDLPPLPNYDYVSESEDEWFSVNNRKPSPALKSNLIGVDGNPPTYEAVTSEGSEVENRPTKSNRNRSRLRSRSSRSSVSNIYQTRTSRVNSDSDSDSNEEGNGESARKTRNRLKSSSLKAIEGSDDETEVGSITVNVIPPTEQPSTSNASQRDNNIDGRGYHSDRPESHLTDGNRHSGRSRSYNDLARHAIYNSIGKSVILNKRQKELPSVSDHPTTSERTAATTVREENEPSTSVGPVTV